MRIINQKKLLDFAAEHANVRDALFAWYDDVKNAYWHTPGELAQRYGWDSGLPESRALFRIKGNACRLVVRINYEFQIVDIRFVGTHAEYDRIDAIKI
jgi:mRNA interferase HigB